MYAHLIQGRATPATRAALDRVVADELMPALHREPGFAGALNLVDRRTGDAIVIVLWTTAEQARRPHCEHGPGVVRALTRLGLAADDGREPIPVWEVNLRV